MTERSPLSTPGSSLVVDRITAPQTAACDVDLGSVGAHLCHTWQDEGGPLCGIGRDGDLPDHDWIQPVDGICPTCNKRSCPTCDVMSDVLDWSWNA